MHFYNKFTPQDFSGLRFNIYRESKPLKNLLDRDPLLRRIDSFAKLESNPDQDKLIAYVILMYDKGSPFIKSFTDTKLRKREVAAYAGFENIDSEEMQAIYEFTNPLVYPMVSDLCKYINDRYWNLIILHEQTLLEYEEALLTQVINFKDDKNRLDAIVTKQKILVECDEITNRLEGYYKKVFSDPEILERVKKNTISPESFANTNNGKRAA